MAWYSYIQVWFMENVFCAQVIVLDTDVTFETDIAELWKIFRVLKGKQVSVHGTSKSVCQREKIRNNRNLKSLFLF